MKKQFLLLLILMVSVVYSSSAYVIILQGGGRNHLYNYVRVTNSRCECRGVGHNGCPVKFTASFKGVKFDFSEVVQEVLSRCEKGDNNGTIFWKEVVPVEWKTTDKEELVITTQEDEINLPK